MKTNGLINPGKGSYWATKPGARGSRPRWPPSASKSTGRWLLLAHQSAFSPRQPSGELRPHGGSKGGFPDGSEGGNDEDSPETQTVSRGQGEACCKSGHGKNRESCQGEKDCGGGLRG
jgi:hypothetical protein